MVIAIKVALFVAASGAIAWLSRRPLTDPRHHGFYRFFAWEAILALFLMNVDHWFADPFSPRQLAAWALLIVSLVLIVEGVRLLRGRGRPDQAREGDALLGIEKTTELVTTGAYRYIRHPFYASLLYLAWGICLKQPGAVQVALALVATGFLVATAKAEERENIAYFGDAYRDYMTRTKMFIPLLF
ncbi:MAG: isoprenylcysteine carboxylmethyltransferase family protein [Hyphomicrobiales bacterium]|nr:isoprenylcysteine carboxylmethyltransferase family protein [Hyphomicrobiales bacterium]MCP5370423.1 isoprenylcysteine carboxylmethyltransferase family protein [Hyphomicrobiales bacterium]